MSPSTASDGRLVDAVLLPGFTGEGIPDWLARAADGGLAGVCVFAPNVGGDFPALTRALHGRRPGFLVASDDEPRAARHAAPGAGLRRRRDQRRTGHARDLPRCRARPRCGRGRRGGRRPRLHRQPLLPAAIRRRGRLPRGARRADRRAGRRHPRQGARGGGRAPGGGAGVLGRCGLPRGPAGRGHRAGHRGRRQGRGRGRGRAHRAGGAHHRPLGAENVAAGRRREPWLVAALRHRDPAVTAGQAAPPGRPLVLVATGPSAALDAARGARPDAVAVHVGLPGTWTPPAPSLTVWGDGRAHAEVAARLLTGSAAVETALPG